VSGFLADMSVFAAVVRDGGFTAAARSLGLTKQSVSERIARLEQRLGVQLLIRSTRALRLTEIGARYHEACTAIVAQAEQAESDARQAQHHPVGIVRVTAPVGLGAPLLVPTVRELRRLHPDVRVELVLDETIVDLIRDGVDLALRAGSVESTPTFFARTLFETFTVVVASPAYLVEHRPREARELAHLPCIARRRADTWNVEGQRVAIDGVVTVNTFEAARDAALAGIGIAQIPMPIVLDDVRTGRLEILFAPTRRFTFTALWPAKRLPMRVKLFHELLGRRALELATTIDATLAKLRLSSGRSRRS
jgi:DNA-binding transcriptional LysR family regulator